MLPTPMNRGQLLSLLRHETVPTYIMLVGAPGSGKTTIAEDWEKAGLACLSMDRIVLENPWMIRMLEMLDTEFSRKLDRALSARAQIVDDNLNISRAERKRVLKRARSQGYRTVVLYLDAPLNLCLRQNRQRSPSVPDNRLEMLWNTLQSSGVPTEADGDAYRLTPLPESDTYLVAPITGAASDAPRMLGTVLGWLRDWKFW